MAKAKRKGETKATAKRYRQPSARRVLAMDTREVLATLRGASLSMRAIEAGSGVSRSMLSRIESGERTECTQRTFAALALLAIDRKLL